jgi:hypothetical protein
MSGLTGGSDPPWVNSDADADANANASTLTRI